jgi:helicase
MKIEALRRFGIPEQVIRRWSTDGIRFLLPLQAESVNRYRLLDGESLIISGPGTSGKTFCGEMAALHQAASRKKAVFLVPLKAIAEEKYWLFAERYSPLGLKIRLSTRDHSEHDRQIFRAGYDILITIYEKFNSLTAVDVSMVKNTGCFVLDEFQLISNPDRGAEIEMVMAKIRAFNPGSQLVILMGGGSSPERISQWLGLPALEETRRPVDLRLGVLHRGTFHFRAFNDLTEGDERWLEERQTDYDGPLDDQSAAAIRILAGRGEQIIIFTSARKKATRLASHLAERLDLRAAEESLKGISDLAPSVQNELLAKCLHHGIAFHHAELDCDQRELVEDGFRRGEIRILSSTSTLAWGVNLPAKNVFVEMMRYDGVRSSNCRETLVPLSATDFQQAAGRAGRLGVGDKFGRAVMIAATPYEQEILWNQYVYARNEDPESNLGRRQIPDLAIRLVACGIAASPDEIVRAVSNLFGAFSLNGKRDISEQVESALSYLEKGGLINFEKPGNIVATSLGIIACTTGFSVQSIVRINEALCRGEIKEPLEWLYFAFGLREWSEAGGFYDPRGASASELLSRIDELSGGLSDRSEYISSVARFDKDASVVRSLSAFLFALEWIGGRPTREIEIAFDRGGGGLKRDAQTLSWILTVIEKVLRCQGSASDSYNIIADGLNQLPGRMRYGVTEDMLPLAKTLDIDREFIRRLYNLGIRAVDDFRDIDYSVLKEMLPPNIIEKIQNRLRSHGQKKLSPDSIRPSAEKLKILFTGKSEKLLKEARIEGQSIFLQPKLYSYLQKLWWGNLSGNPWIHKESLEAGVNQPKYISKLRKILKQGGANVEIISNGRGFYRLLLPESVDGSDVAGDDEHVGIDQRR